MQLNYFNRPYFENGAIQKISEVLNLHGIKNPLICSDPGLSSIGMTDKIKNLITDDFSSSFYEETPANPTEKAVNEALNLYTLGYDLNKKLTTLNAATKTNLSTYLSKMFSLTSNNISSS